MFSDRKYGSFRWLSYMAVAGMIFLLPAVSSGQFAPPAGQPGSTAIKADSAVFVQWASSCMVTRGYMDISDTTLGKASYGTDTLAIGRADNSVVSLGDGGWAVLYFETPLTDGPGFDFAVFENSFSDDFLELAFVEVSSDGINFYRFASVSNTPTDEQVSAFGILDATKIHNLAGKYRGGYGTPFDLAELNNIEGLDVRHIIAVKVIDVVGSIDTLYATYDSRGNIMNDPWPTPFESSGFDLDAVGVIYDQNHTTVEENPRENFISITPNPVMDYINIKGVKPGCSITIFDRQARLVYASPVVKNTELSIPITGFPKGLLLVSVKGENFIKTFKIIHL